MKRIVSIDIARAIGIVLVVIGHYMPEGAPFWYEGMRNWIYSFHMPLFMFLSGYVYSLTARKETYLSFLSRKAARLLIPYLIVSVVIILIKLAGQKVLGIGLKNPVGADAFIRMLAYPEAAIHLWFIFALWWIFVIVPFFNWKGGHISLLIIAAALHYLPRILPSIIFPGIFCLNQAAEYFLYFMLGAVIYDSGFNLGKPHKVLAVAALVLFALNSVFRFATYASEYIGIAGILGLAALLQFAPEKCLKPVLAVSESSYCIYLVHSIFMGFAVTALKVFPAFLDTTGSLFAPGALIIVSVSLSLSVLTHFLIRRIRSTRLSGSSPEFKHETQSGRRI